MFSGKKIREIRKRKGLTLSDVSAMSGVTESQISQIENNKANPSISTLIQIAQALNIPMMTFFGKDANSDYPVLRENERTLILDRAGVKFYLLTHNIKDDMELLYAEYEVGGKSSETGELYTHNGVELGLVLKGKLEVIIEEEHYVLNAGDSIRIESTKPHLVRNIGESVSTAVWINSPPTF